MKLRKSLILFAGKMEKRLKANDHKGRTGWVGYRPEELGELFGTEVMELGAAIGRGNPEEILSEAADVANFAMMIGDNARRQLEKKMKKEAKRA